MFKNALHEDHRIGTRYLVNYHRYKCEMSNYILEQNIQ